MKGNLTKVQWVGGVSDLIIDMNAVLGMDVGSVTVKSLGARCLGGGTLRVCLCKN